MMALGNMAIPAEQQSIDKGKTERQSADRTTITTWERWVGNSEMPLHSETDP